MVPVATLVVVYIEDTLPAWPCRLILGQAASPNRASYHYVDYEGRSRDERANIATGTTFAAVLPSYLHAFRELLRREDPPA